MTEHKVSWERSFPTPTTAHYALSCICGWSEMADNKKDAVNKKRLHIGKGSYAG